MAKKVLVIDDEKSVRDSFYLALKNSDYAVDLAENGTIGLEKYGEKEYDVVFLDLRMPGMNGVEVLKRIRETDDNTPVYVVTTFHNMYFEELKELEVKKMDFQLINKPVSGEQITAVLDGVLGNTDNNNNDDGK